MTAKKSGLGKGLGKGLDSLIPIGDTISTKKPIVCLFYKRLVFLLSYDVSTSIPSNASNTSIYSSLQ